MKIQNIAIIAFSALLLTGCGFPVRMTEVRGTGNIITETRPVAGFDAVDLSGIGTLIIVQGEREALEISAEENLMPYLKSDVKGDQLELGIKDYVNLQPTRDITYRLTVKNLKRIETSGLGKIQLAALETGSLRIGISGSGRVTIDKLIADSANFEISGMGDISVSGTVKDQHIGVSGSGNLNAQNLQSQTAEVDISGMGNVVLWVIETLDLELSGAGKVSYYGSPTINSDVSGAGTVQSLGNK